jgi:hypothetical protein
VIAHQVVKWHIMTLQIHVGLMSAMTVQFKLIKE